MPAFIKTPADEARWEKAKAAARKTLSESAGDSFWALTNSIYHKMTKSEEEAADAMQLILEKARRRLSDEPADDEEESDVPAEGFREFDPDTEHGDSDKWLQENDPEYVTGDEEPSDEEPSDEESQPVVAAPKVQESAAAAEVAPAPELKDESKFQQPSREDIAEMRRYTRPWEQRARDQKALTAEAHKNPVLFHQGKLAESRGTVYKDWQQAYDKVKNSPEYQKAGPIQRVKMDAQFKKDWHEKNPEHAKQAMLAHQAAHKEGEKAHGVHEAAKEEQIRHVLTGGAQPEVPMSTEAALQHAGGVKGDEGTVGSTIQDRASAFAHGNRQFLDQYAKDYEKKQKKPANVEDMANYDEGSKADVTRVLGEHPALKDPSKKAQVDKFFQQYHPLIGMSAHRVLNKLGMDPKRGDVDLGMLHEAGMHGLFQAINDYDHDHPSKANFATHAGNKIRGLMQTALRAQDEIPQELRVGAKRFQQPTVETPAAPVQAPSAPGTAAPGKTEDVASFMQRGGQVTKVPPMQALVGKHPPEVADRMKRIQTFRSAHGIKKPEGGNQ